MGSSRNMASDSSGMLKTSSQAVMAVLIQVMMFVIQWLPCKNFEDAARAEYIFDEGGEVVEDVGLSFAMVYASECYAYLKRISASAGEGGKNEMSLCHLPQAKLSVIQGR